MDRIKLGNMITERLRDRKSYVFVPKGLSEYLVASIERPDQMNRNYLTGSLIEYLKKRKLSLVVSNEVYGEKRVLESNLDIHLVIRKAMSFFMISDTDLADEGLDYHSYCGTDTSIRIDRFLELMERMKFKITIK